MKPNRSLALRREILTELTADELSFRGAGNLTLEPGCSVNDVTDAAKDAMIRLTLHPHCSWSCI